MGRMLSTVPQPTAHARLGQERQLRQALRRVPLALQSGAIMSIKKCRWLPPPHESTVVGDHLGWCCELGQSRPVVRSSKEESVLLESGANAGSGPGPWEEDLGGVDEDRDGSVGPVGRGRLREPLTPSQCQAEGWDDSTAKFRAMLFRSSKISRVCLRLPPARANEMRTGARCGGRGVVVERVFTPLWRAGWGRGGVGGVCVWGGLPAGRPHSRLCGTRPAGRVRVGVREDGPGPGDALE